MKLSDEAFKALSASTSTEDVLNEFGQLLEPTLMGPASGFTNKAIEYIQRNICPTPCENLANGKQMAYADLTVAIAELLLRSLGVDSKVPVSLVWKIAATYVKYELPIRVQCARCPLNSR